jgi:hypothetical protein
MDNINLILIIIIIVILIIVFCNRSSQKEDFVSRQPWCKADNWNSSNNRWNGEFWSWNCSRGIDCQRGAIQDNSARGHILADGKSYDGWMNFKDTRNGKQECKINQEY